MSSFLLAIRNIQCSFCSLDYCSNKCSCEGRLNCSTAVLSGCEGDRNWVAMLFERLRFSGLQLINAYMGHWFSLCKKNGSIRTLNNYMPRRSAGVLLNLSFQSMCPQHFDPCAMSHISCNHFRATQHQVHIKSGPHEIKPQNQGDHTKSSSYHH